MRYEHLIEINDPLMSLLDTLTHDDLWEGLVWRAYAPQHFILGLEDASVEELSSDGVTTVLRRTLNYGRFTINDTVTLHSDQTMITDVEANAEVSKSRLTITIEEPAKDRVYLRFLYEIDEDDATSELDTMLVAMREQAYFASDMDTVARIRELAEKRRMQ